MNLRFKHRGDEAEFVNCNGCSQATYDIGTRLNKKTGGVSQLKGGIVWERRFHCTSRRISIRECPIMLDKVMMARKRMVSDFSTKTF
jgi:hypothetical protein